MEHINFTKNFNNKLLGEFLTTYRSSQTISDKHLKIGDEVELQINHIPVAIASIKEMLSFNFHDLYINSSILMRMLLSVDTGADLPYSFFMIKKMCGEKVTLLLLKIEKRL